MNAKVREVPVRFHSTGGTFRLRAAAATTETSPKEASATRPMGGVAYNGGILYDTLGRPVVVDLEGLAPLKEGGVPMLYQHTEAVGIVRSVAPGDGVLSYEGQLISSIGRGAMIATFADIGYPWELSIHAEAEDDGVEEVHEGQTATANGQIFEGPILIYRQSRIREISVTETGQDPDTATQIAARAGGGATRRVRVSSPETRTMAETTTEAGAETTAASVEGLRSAHPELVQQIEAAARDAGIVAERERVASILEATQSALADDPAPEGEQASAPSPTAEAMAVAASAISKGDGVNSITAALVKIARRAGGAKAQTAQDARRAVTASATAVETGTDDAVTTGSATAASGPIGALMASASSDWKSMSASQRAATKCIDEDAYVGERLLAAKGK